MKSRRSKWVGGIGTMGLAVGFLALAGFAVGTAPSDAQAGPIDEFKGGKAVELSKRFTILDSFNKEAALDSDGELEGSVKCEVLLDAADEVLTAPSTSTTTVSPPPAVSPNGTSIARASRGIQWRGRGNNTAKRAASLRRSQRSSA